MPKTPTKQASEVADDVARSFKSISLLWGELPPVKLESVHDRITKAYGKPRDEED